MADILTRSNTLTLSFAFKDENGEAANVASATCQLVYPGRDMSETETVTLSQSGSSWTATWDSTKSRPGWIEFHAHAISTGTPVSHYTEDGRFKLAGNEANYQHDELPGGNSSYRDYGA